MSVEAQFDAAERLVLRYLFVACYEDGTVYEQGPSDESLFGGANAYTDIYYKPFKPLAELVTFALVGQGHTYLVDLRDGHFEIDGVPFEASPMETPVPPGGKYELVYWRGHKHVHQPGCRTTHFVHYRIGWKYQLGDKVITQTISVE